MYFKPLKKLMLLVILFAQCACSSGVAMDASGLAIGLEQQDDKLLCTFEWTAEGPAWFLKPSQSVTVNYYNSDGQFLKSEKQFVAFSADFLDMKANESTDTLTVCKSIHAASVEVVFGQGANRISNSIDLRH
jgi:hypothetical protein